jgi:hypothetical protein
VENAWKSSGVEAAPHAKQENPMETRKQIHTAYINPIYKLAVSMKRRV